MRLFCSALIAASMLAAAPAIAGGKDQAAPTPAPARPITDRSVGAVDVIATPASDLNLRKGEIPPMLTAAIADPYDLTGTRTCAQISRAVTDLDGLLGPDRDIPMDRAERLSAGRIAQSVVGSFIPFRGIIREVSGANSQQRKIDDAVTAGTARRSFLKGYGQARGCAYPAREVTPAALTALIAQADKDKADAAAAKEASRKK